MILVDTSVWIDHFRKSDTGLKQLLRREQVVTHPFVIGEIALGHLKNRIVILDSLYNLPAATLASDLEVIKLIDIHGLAGTGIGYMDAHLLASLKLMPGALLWTRDKKLRTVVASFALELKETATP